VTAGTGPGTLVIPELGPSLGRLVAPPPPPPGAVPQWISLDDIRLALVTQLFDLAGEARRWADQGERELALVTLSHEALAGVWQNAVHSVAARGAEAISQRLVAAAREARLPGRRARSLPLDPDEVAALAARLATGTPALERALESFDQAGHRLRRERASPGALREWQDALNLVARRVESAWLGLEDALALEWHEWAVEIEEVRAWRRPLWPLVAVGLVLFGLAGYAGLVLGGYLPVPGPLRGIAEAIWTRWN